MCTNRAHDLLYTTLFALLLYLVLSKVCNFMGLTFVSYLLFAAIPFFVSWRCFGISPACAPMLPPCLLDDVEAALASIFPASARFPEKLICSTPGFDGCLPDCQPPAPYTNGTTVCLRS